MIRDPSDGTVKEIIKPDLSSSGLRKPSEKPGEIARLEKSREWLRKFLDQGTIEDAAPSVRSPRQ